MSTFRFTFQALVFLLAGPAVFGATDGCLNGVAPFAKRSQVPKAAFAQRNKTACSQRAVGNTTAAVQWTQLRFYLLATGRAPVLLPQTGAGFSSQLNAQNLGAVGITYTNSGTTPMTGVRLIAFADLDIDRLTNGFANEYGAFVSLATPPGAPAGAIAANAWEIDEPGFLFGNILTNAAAGILDNFNAIPNGAPDDVSFALQFPVGDLAPGQLFSAQIRLDAGNIGGLQQVDRTTNTTVYLNGFAAKAAVLPPAPPPPVTPEIPTPSSLPLLLIGLGVTYSFRRQLFGRK
jgi:hypothetical protein